MNSFFGSTLESLLGDPRRGWCLGRQFLRFRTGRRIDKLEISPAGISVSPVNVGRRLSRWEYSRRIAVSLRPWRVWSFSKQYFFLHCKPGVQSESQVLWRKFNLNNWQIQKVFNSTNVFLPLYCNEVEWQTILLWLLLVYWTETYRESAEKSLRVPDKIRQCLFCFRVNAAEHNSLTLTTKWYRCLTSRSQYRLRVTSTEKGFVSAKASFNSFTSTESIFINSVSSLPSMPMIFCLSNSGTNFPVI